MRFAIFTRRGTEKISIIVPSESFTRESILIYLLALVSVSGKYNPSVPRLFPPAGAPGAAEGGGGTGPEGAVGVGEELDDEDDDVEGLSAEGAAAPEEEDEEV